jgi:low molecular weight protein-tyrosine phosphatase
VELAGKSRKLAPDDLRRFDWVVVMDTENLEVVRSLQAATRGTANVHLLREFEPGADALDVPDPYYGGARGFEDVHDIVERACAGLLDHILAERGGR